MVYVVQEQAGKNILSAAKFGELKILLPPGMQVSFSAGQVTQRLYRDLAKFSDKDFLLLIGDPIAIGIAVAVAAHWNQGRAQLLKWDRQESCYYSVSIDIFNSEERKVSTYDY